MSTPVPPRAAAIAGATSPSRIRLTAAPASRSSPIRSSCRSRSRTTTLRSRTEIPLAFATAFTLSVGDALMSTTSIPSGPTAIFSMYTAAPGKNIVSRSATAITAIAFGWPFAVRRVPSSGSTATSTAGPLPSPTGSPLKSIGASSFSPSPITTTPSMATVSSIRRMASTAAWSAAFLSPRPTQRAAAIAAASVTRTSSSARLRSGACALTRGILWSHPLGRFHADQVERTRDHRLRRAAQAEPERLGVALQHAVLVVEAMEVVGCADGVGRQRVRAAPLRRLGDDAGKFGQPLHELALLARERPRGRPPNLGLARVPEDPGDARVRVLDVVDRVLLALLGREVDVDLDRLVRSPRDEVPAGGVDADLVHELVQGDDVAAPLRHLRLLAAARQVDELVQEHLDPGRVVAEHGRNGRVPLARAVVVGAEHVDGAVESPLELVGEVDHVRAAIGRRPALLGRADDDAVLVVVVR